MPSPLARRVQMDTPIPAGGAGSFVLKPPAHDGRVFPSASCVDGHTDSFGGQGGTFRDEVLRRGGLGGQVHLVRRFVLLPAENGRAARIGGTRPGGSVHSEGHCAGWVGGGGGLRAIKAQ